MTRVLDRLPVRVRTLSAKTDRPRASRREKAKYIFIPRVLRKGLKHEMEKIGGWTRRSAYKRDPIFRWRLIAAGSGGGGLKGSTPLREWRLECPGRTLSGAVPTAQL